MNNRFDSPEQAAMNGLPERYCGVIASRVHADDAYVLLNAGTDTYRYLYGVHCWRDDRGWAEVSGSNGGGWSQTGPDDHLGVLVMWDDAPSGAEAVRVRCGGETQHVPVEHGAFLAVWWRVPCPADDWPFVEAIRIGDEWVSHE